jgi:hypothetical protein
MERERLSAGGRAAGDPRELPPIQLDPETQRRYDAMRDSPETHARTILLRKKPGEDVAPPPDKSWDEMSNYERGWAIAYEYQERPRREAALVAEFRHAHPVVYQRMLMGARVRVFFARLLVFVVVLGIWSEPLLPDQCASQPFPIIAHAASNSTGGR